MGVACDIIAPSLVPVRAGDRVKTDRRDAKKLVRLQRAGELSFVSPPTPELEGLRDLLRCRDDLRCARTAARHRVAKQLLRHGRVYGEGKTPWTLTHRAWIARQRLAEPLTQLALEQMIIHLDGIDRQLEPESTDWLVGRRISGFVAEAAVCGGDRDSSISVRAAFGGVSGRWREAGRRARAAVIAPGWRDCGSCS